MEKSYQSSTADSNKTDQFLKQLNKSSHKISKPQQQQQQLNHLRQQQQQQQISQAAVASSQQTNSNNSQQQQQPPVYNINKNDFRDVVQKLTGSPAHERLSTPPPIHPPKLQSSRLQRIRPPPLAQVGNRPPPINDSGADGIYAGRPRSPFSPLPPFPTVSAAAESPISAYMRYLQNSISAAGDPDPRRIPGLSPRWNANPASLPQVPIPSPPPAMNPLSSSAPSQLLFPASPLAFGHIPSPRLQYPLLSPSLLFSPTSQLGFPPLPLSPRFPVPSPRWNDL